MPGIGELLIILVIVSPLLLVLLLLRKKRGTKEWERRRNEIEQLFQQAVGQLGSERAEVRIGAIHSMERLAYELPGLWPAAWDTLDGFVREHLGRLPPDLPQVQVPNDIQAAQTVLGRMAAWRNAPLR